MPYLFLSILPNFYIAHTDEELVGSLDLVTYQNFDPIRVCPY